MGGASSSIGETLPPHLVVNAVLPAVSTMDGLAQGYLSVEAGELVEILYVGDQTSITEHGWVYARQALTGLCGWLPVTALPRLVP